jgi:hypothetical protein
VAEVRDDQALSEITSAFRLMILGQLEPAVKLVEHASHHRTQLVAVSAWLWLSRVRWPDSLMMR